MATSQDTNRGFFRILLVLETVAEQGPLNLDDVTAATGISRTAAFRALKVLEERGWIRPHMGTGAYAVTAGFVGKLRRANKTYEEIDNLLPILKAMAKEHKVHFDIAVLEDLIVPRVVESTRRKRIEDPIGFFDSPFAMVALAAEDPRMRMMVLKAAMDSANPDQKEMVRSGEINAKIKSIGAQGFDEDHANRAFIIPLSGFGSFSGALRVASSLTNQPRSEVVKNVADTLQSGNYPAIPARFSIQSVNN